MVAFSSRLALKELLKDLERHSGQRRQVYLAVLQWQGITGPSREDIAQATGIRLSSICGRVSELLEDGAIERGPMKEQTVVPGRTTPVETLVAQVYRDAPLTEPQQLPLL